MKLSRNKLADASIVIAVVTGLLYISGYVFYEGFFGELKIPVRALDLKFQDVILYGSLPITPVLVLTALFFIIMGALKALHLTFLKSRAYAAFFSSAAYFPTSYLIGSTFFVITILFHLLVQWSSHLGASNGKTFLKGACPVTNIQIMNTDEKSTSLITGCFIISSAGFDWILTRPLTEGSDRRVIAIPVSSVAQIDIH